MLKNVEEKREPLCTVGANGNQSDKGKEYRGSFKNYNQLPYDGQSHSWLFIRRK